MKKILTHTLIAGIIILPTLVFAQNNIGLQNPIKVNSISELILIVTRVVRYIAIPFVVIAIMYVGWLFLWSGYNPGKLNDAKNALYYVFVGAFILLSSELIALVMRNTIQGLTK
jgi:hypothetical protein